jgi:hypothetical protein
MASFDYSSRDYSTIKSDLLARASRIAPEWTDRDPSDFGMVLVDLWSQMGDVLHYYVDPPAVHTVHCSKRWYYVSGIYAGGRNS